MMTRLSCDWMKYGFALFTQQLVSDTLDWTNISSTMFGYIVYYVFFDYRFTSWPTITQQVGKDGTRNAIAMVVFDFVKNGHIASGSLILSLLYLIIGFMVYDFLLDIDLPPGLHVAARYSTMLIVSKWLSGEPFTKSWLIQSAGYIAGLIIFDCIVQ